MNEKTIAAMKAVRQWIYFTFNFHYPKEIFENIWGEILGQHFYHKLVSYDYDFNRLYVEMTPDHQDELIRWVMENYHGVDITNGQYEEK